MEWSPELLKKVRDAQTPRLRTLSDRIATLQYHCMTHPPPENQQGVEFRAWQRDHDALHIELDARTREARNIIGMN